MAAAGCRRGEPTVVPGAPVVLISIDTLRSDHLPAYGYRGVATPALDALRADGILYERAYSHYPLTLPSHVSLLSGLLPPQHGVRDNVGYTVDAEKVVLLPRQLARLGYATGGAVSAFVLRGATGLGAAFDFYDDAIETKRGAPLGGQQRAGGDTLAQATAWLRGVAGGKFFLFFHLYEPHTPYAPPEPFASRYANRYDGEVAAADAVVGRLLDELKRLGVYERTLIVLVSDHGEALGEHGEEEHGIFLYRETLQVPLLVKLPGGALRGRSVAAAAQLADVVPTVLEVVGAETPAGLPGRSLVALAGDLQPPQPRPIYSETYFARLHMGWSELVSVIDGDRHYIQAPEPELYDLAADPAETANILRDDRRAYAALRAEAARWSRPLDKPQEVDAETTRSLAALGYLGGVALGADEGPLPDPKSQLDVLADLKQASRAFFAKDYAQAVPLFERVLRQNPRMQDPREQLALSLWRLGRFSEAAAAYEQALQMSGSLEYALNLAALYQDMGRLDDARRHAELALQTNAIQAHARLADIALQAKDLEAAERHARQAAEARDGRVGPLIVLAQVLARRHQLDQALALIQQADAELGRRESRDDPAGFEFVYGDVLARLGRGEEAKRRFLVELERYPDSLDVYTRLAVLAISEGRTDDGVRMLRAMVERNRSAAAYAAAVETLRVVGDERAASSLLAHARRLYPESQQLRALAG